MSHLVFERTPGKSFFIGDDIEVQVQAIRGRRAVRIAVTAPRHIPVVREELRTKKAGASAGTESMMKIAS